MSLTGRSLYRLYWGACGLLLVIGIAGTVGVVAFPPERFDDEGYLIGEMPPEFGAALAAAALGALGLLAGLAVFGLARLCRWTRGRRMR
ncbi:hypothetical protein [Azospirillum sp. sgz301742]